MLEKAKADLADAVEKRDELNAQIGSLANLVAGINNVSGDPKACDEVSRKYRREIKILDQRKRKKKRVNVAVVAELVDAAVSKAAGKP